MLSPTFLAPPALAPGATIAVVAPSGPFDSSELERGVHRLEERYSVRYGKALFDRKGYLAGSDEDRANDLLEALQDPEVAALVAARGGYGATRLLDRLNPAAVRAARKLLIGFSDVTALHALWARAGVRSIHGPMVCAFGRAEAAQIERFVSVVEGALPPPIERLTTLVRGEVEGPLVGGNLAVFTALLGTPYTPDLTGKVLFLEDVGERPYRIDRMLTTLRQAGIFERANAVVVGSFTESLTGPDGISADDVIRERLEDLRIPVLTGLPCGHRDDNVELPFGARVRVEDGRLRFLEPAVIPTGE